jgi:hypothetical protein
MQDILTVKVQLTLYATVSKPALLLGRNVPHAWTVPPLLG